MGIAIEIRIGVENEIKMVGGGIKINIFIVGRRSREGCRAFGKRIFAKLKMLEPENLET